MNPLPLLLRRRPSPGCLTWVERAVGGGCVISARRLRGGTSTAVHALLVEDTRGRAHRLVLKRYVRLDWLEREPDVPRREASVLSLLGDAGLPAPELIAADLTGEDCEIPAVLMTRLPGRVDLDPPDRTSWLRQQAEALPAVHALHVPEGDGVSRYFTYSDVSRLAPPSWSRAPEAWGALLRRAAAPPPATAEAATFIHRDYHPGNVLWTRGRLSGVVDWTNACLGPPGIDVGHARVNIATLFGVRTADAFLDAYRAASGGEQDPYWDALSAADILPDPDDASGASPDAQIALQWNDLGREDITVDLLRQRLDAYAVSIAARL